MFRGRLRTLVTLTVVIEGSIAGWAVGAGWLGPLAMIALVITLFPRTPIGKTADLEGYLPVAVVASL